MSAQRQIDRLMTVFDLEHPESRPDGDKGSTRVMIIYDRAADRREFKVLSKETPRGCSWRIRAHLEATLDAAGND